MVEIFQCGYYLVLLVGFICLLFYAKRLIEKPSKTEILLDRQTDLLRIIDNTLVGIDCRLQEIQEKNSGGLNG